MGEAQWEKQWWQSGWFAIVMLCLTLGSIVWAMYTYFDTKQEKAPTYSVENTALLSKSRISIKKLKVLYGDVPVHQLTSTNIRFWNAGRKAIDGKDISRSEPLCICVPKDAQVLSYDSIKETATNAKPTLTPSNTHSGKRILVDFEFLNRSEGFWIQILHDGDADCVWRVTGKIKESQPITVFESPDHFKSNSDRFKCIFIGVLSICGFVSLVRSMKYAFHYKSRKFLLWSIPVAAFLLASMIFVAFILIADRSANSAIPHLLR